MSKKFVRIIVYMTLLASLLLGACQPAAPTAAPATQPPAAQPTTAAAAATEAPAAPTAPAAPKKLVYCYITPGPDTWYKRDVEGFQFAAKQDNVEVLVVNSEYSVEKELANIDYCINQGVDGISIFSFNENGARIAAEKGKAAGIPVVATDSVGSVVASGTDIVAEVDFDWTKMGEAYAQWMADNRPGEDFAIITGSLESIPCQKINEAMKTTSEKLGKNKLLDVRPAAYSPDKAVEVAQDMISSGLAFKVLFVMDEDMAASVIRMLKTKNLLNNPITVIAQNGSTSGIPLVKAGELKYTISSSPGWEGNIAYLALHNYVLGLNKTTKQHIFLPIMPITETNIDDPMQVVPWEVNGDVYNQLTAKYFPDLLTYKK